MAAEEGRGDAKRLAAEKAKAKYKERRQRYDALDYPTVTGIINTLKGDITKRINDLHALKQMKEFKITNVAPVRAVFDPIMNVLSSGTILYCIPGRLTPLIH